MCVCVCVRVTFIWYKTSASNDGTVIVEGTVCGTAIVEGTAQPLCAAHTCLVLRILLQYLSLRTPEIAPLYSEIYTPEFIHAYPGIHPRVPRKCRKARRCRWAVRRAN